MEQKTLVKATEKTNLETNLPLLEWKVIQLRSNELAYVSSTKELYNLALDLLLEITCGDSATYFQYSADNNDLVVSAIRGDDESQHLIGLRIPQQEALLQVTLAENEPVMIGDLQGDPRWLRVASPTSAARMVNLISLPLVAQRRLLGVIHIYNYKQVDLDQIDMLRERIALEVDRRAILEATQRKNEQLNALIQSLGQIGGTLDRKQMLQTILEQSAKLVEAERTSIFITNPGTNELSFQLAYQPDNDNNLASNFGFSFNHFLNGSADRKVAHPTPNRSVITIPLRSSPESSDPDSKSHQFGGLTIVKPNQSTFSGEDTELLNILIQQASTFFQAAEIFEGMEELFFDVIEALVASMEAKDTYTQGHSKRVSEYSVLIAQELGLDGIDIQNIRIASLLHDVGKIGIPDKILKKKGKLTTEEKMIIHNHPLTGWRILREVRMLEPMMPAIIEHHEKLDGSGYPYGLRGDQISLMARIVAVADVFDAMTSDRPYRNAIPVPEVLAYLEENSGTLFDERCVDILKLIIYRSVMVQDYIS